MGMFYGFKLHAIVDEEGRICRFLLAPAHVSDQEAARALLAASDAFVLGDKNYHGCGVYAQSKANFKHPKYRATRPPLVRVLYRGHRRFPGCVRPSSGCFLCWCAAATWRWCSSIPSAPFVSLSVVKLQLTILPGSCFTDSIP